MGSRILYYGLIIPLSYLPIGVLYVFSDVLYFALYRMSGYRKGVVLGNMRRVFPQKSETEINELASKFYHHFCDLVVESIKSFTITEKAIKERVKSPDTAIPDAYFDRGQDILMVSGHFGNWELYATAAGFQTKHQIIGIYKKLSNEFFDEKIRFTRGRFGCKMTGSKFIDSAFEKGDRPVGVGFLMDQAPTSSTRAWWMDFLGQDTAVLFGSEKYARKYDVPVVYGRMDKVKRGHYVTSYELVCDDPKTMEKGEITEKMTKMLEADILRTPEFWLWTHKRWKRRRDDGT